MLWRRLLPAMNERNKQMKNGAYAKEMYVDVRNGIGYHTNRS